MTTPSTRATPAPGPRWRTDISRPPTPVELFGKDHWSALAYVESRAVDYRGVLDHDRMRCSPTRHPMLMAAKRLTVRGVSSTGYPTRIKAHTSPGDNGHFAVAELPDHDDYDVLDDLLAAGLLTVRMPGTDAEGCCFLTATGGAISHNDGAAIHPGHVTGADELWLGAFATWGLTEHGRAVAARLRAFKADGGRFHDFVEPRTTKATLARIRQGYNRKADLLSDAGWLVLPPEVVARLHADALAAIRAACQEATGESLP